METAICNVSSVHAQVQVIITYEYAWVVEYIKTLKW